MATSPPDSPGERLQAALEESGKTVRGLAAELQARKPRKALESWRTTLRRILKDKERPGAQTGALLSELLGKPDGHFVMPRETAREEAARLRLENEELRGRLEAQESGGSGDA